MTSAASNETRLARALRTGQPSGRVSPPDLFELARDKWRKGERIDVGKLAAEIGIGRATAFRWVGSRDELLGEVIWSYYEPTLHGILRAETARGPQRIASVTAKAMRAILDFAPMRAWLERDPEYALRIVAAENSVVQIRTLAFARDMIQTEIAAGEMQPLLDVETLSLLVMRISTSFLYSDITCARQPSVDSAYTAVHILAAATP